jgi:SAM-dependent methyltransferase
MNAKQAIVKAEFLLQGVLARIMNANVACPHCSGTDADEVGRKAHVVKVMQCSGCGLYFTSPLYRSWLSPNFYDRLYTAEGSTTGMPAAETLARLKASAFEGSDKDGSAVLEAIRVTVGSTGRLLEFGSSWGYLLYQAKNAGFEAIGVEIANDRRKYGVQNLGVTIVPTLGDVRSGPFDIVYAAHVLEHLTDVRTVYDELASLLRPGGHIFLEVPNFDPRQFGERVYPLVGAVHPLGYDSNWFLRNLGKHGFHSVGVYPDWQSVSEMRAARSSSSVIVVHALVGNPLRND